MSDLEFFQQVRAQAEKDSRMLKTTAAELRSGVGFSVNPTELAKLLDRLRDEHIDHLL